MRLERRVRGFGARIWLLLLLCVGARGRRRPRIGNRRVRGIHFLLVGWLGPSGTSPFLYS